MSSSATPTKVTTTTTTEECAAGESTFDKVSHTITDAFDSAVGAVHDFGVEHNFIEKPKTPLEQATENVQVAATNAKVAVQEAAQNVADHLKATEAKVAAK